VWSPPTTPGGEGTPAPGRRAGHRRRSASPAPPRDARGSRAAAARELAVVGGAGDGGGMEALPEDLSALLEEYGRHLRLGRNRSEETVRAYVGDARAVLGHLYARSADSALGELDLGVLRSWLAELAAGGAARTTLARRASSARTFTAWLTRTGRLAEDPGLRLASPKAHRTLHLYRGRQPAVAV